MKILYHVDVQKSNTNGNKTKQMKQTCLYNNYIIKSYIVPI